MRRGAKPKPTGLKKIAGTFRPCRAPAGPEPLVPGLIDEPPAHFTARQRELWEEAKANAPRQLWRKADAAMLQGFVIGLSLLETANIEQAKIDAGNGHPLMVIGQAGTLIPSPYLRV